MSTTFENEYETPEMETLAGLAENLVYRLPGCMDVMVRKTLQETYRDFCRRSCCLRVRRQFKVSPDDHTLPLVPVVGGMVDSVADISCNRRALVKGRDYEVLHGLVSLRRHVVPKEGTEERFYPIVSFNQVEIPAIGQETAPKWFLAKYGDSICSGVLSRLMSMSGKAWSDPSQAQSETIRYENAVCEARISYYNGSENGDGGLGYGFDPNDLV